MINDTATPSGAAPVGVYAFCYHSRFAAKTPRGPIAAVP